jgi:putative peptidoglycan lipid II flippase
MALASGLMAAALLVLAPMLSPWLGPDHAAVVRFGALGALVGVGVVVYFGAAYVLGGFRLGPIGRALSRRRT